MLAAAGALLGALLVAVARWRRDQRPPASTSPAPATVTASG